MNADFATRLADRILAGQPPCVVGLDPRLDALPRAVAPGAEPAARIVAFHRAVLPVLARSVPVVKPNIAFYERYGAAGFGAYETSCRLAREAGLLVIGDVKRGDIGSTADAYAAAHLPLADAITVQPYLGSDSLQPFLARCRAHGCGLFVLVRTSNPSAAEFQDLPVGADTLAETVARAVDRWGRADVGARGYGPVGAVVGATEPGHLARLRALMPHAWLLLPGIGAQGGSVEDVAPAFDERGLGALLSQSRGVLQSFAPDDADWLDRVAAAAADFAQRSRSVAASRR
jgi:orotidine-5'-phosphate decarboxylase